MPNDFSTNPRYAGLRARQQRNRDKGSAKQPAAPLNNSGVSSSSKPAAKSSPVAPKKAAPAPVKAPIAQPVSPVNKPVKPAPKAPEPVYHQPTTPETKVVVEKPIYVPEPSVTSVPEETKQEAKPIVQEAPAIALAPEAKVEPAPAPVAQPIEAAPSAAPVAPSAPVPPASAIAPERPPYKDANVGIVPEKPLAPDYRINHKRAGLIVIASFLILFGLAGLYFAFRLNQWFSDIEILATIEGYLGAITLKEYVVSMMSWMSLAIAVVGGLAIFDLVMVALHSKKEHGKLVFACIGGWLSVIVLMADLGWSGWVFGTNLDDIRASVTSLDYFKSYDFIPVCLYLIAVVLVIIFLVKAARCSHDAKRIERGTPSPKNEASGVKKQPLEAKANAEKIVGARSYFDGKPLHVIGIKLFVFFFTLLSLTLAFPWLYCYESRWRCSHTVVEGYRLGFDGRGKDLFWSWLSYLGLGLVTLLLYWLWVPSKLRRFQTAHTYLVRDPKGV
jgi:hypothetical protein